MFRLISVAVLLSAAALSACSPTFNWREVQSEPAALKAMMPCKPDKAQRQVPMAGRMVDLQAMGCETGGASFVLLHADLGDAALAGEALGKWKPVSLSTLRAAKSDERAFLPPGGVALRESVLVVAQGQGSDGRAIEGQLAYFARGSHVFQAAIYAQQIKPEWAQAFFNGLKFQ